RRARKKRSPLRYSSDEKPCQIGIARRSQFFGRTFEINLAAAKNQKAGCGGVRTVFGGMLTVTDDAIGLLIEVKVGQGKAVLQALRGEKRGDAVDVSEAKDPGDDRLRSDGIEACGG